MSMNIRTTTRLASALAALALATGTAWADTHIWTGLGTSAYWSDTHNWDMGAPPYSGEPAPCVLRFPSVASKTFNSNDITGLLVHELRMDRAGYILDLGDVRLTTGITMMSPFPGQSRLYGKPALANDVTMDIGADLELVTYAELGETGGSYGFAKLGEGKLTLSGNNSFKGLVRIVLGFVEVTSNSGLGETDAGVVMENGGGLSLVNVTIKGESLALAYDGPNSVGALYGTGVNEWIGPVDVVRDSSITAAGPGDEITLSGILSGSQALVMRGAGQVILAGDEANKYDGPVTVANGELLLAKHDPNGNKIEALNGPVFIGTPAGVPIARLRLKEDHQIFDKSDVTIRAGGRLELNDHAEAIYNLNFYNGGNADSGPAGLLEINGDITADSSMQAIAQIGGHLSLAGSTRSLIVSNSIGLRVNAIVEDGSAPAGLLKLGLGLAVLNGANTFSGIVTVGEGILTATHPSALGATTQGTVVTSGGTLSMGAGLVITGEPLTLEGMGYAGLGAFGGNGFDVWTGPVTLAGNSRIFCEQGCDLHITSRIAGTGAFQKSGPGRLFLEGTEDNTFAGPLTVSDGLLLLNKTNALAVPGPLIISDQTTNAAARPLRAEQIADGSFVTVNPLGRLEMFYDSFETIAGLSGHGLVIFDHGTLVVGANNANATFQGQLSGAGNGGHTNLIKIGDGNFQLLNATHTHDGVTIARGGLLRMDATQLASLIIVEDGGTLGGHGTCGAVQVNSRGRVTGSSVGSTARLTVGSIPFSPAAVFHVDLAGTTPDTGHDQLRVTGGQNLNNAFLRVNYNYAGAPGDTFVILDNQNASPINGTFANLPEGAVFTTNGIAFRITYVGGNGNDVALTLLAPPDPAEIKLIDYVSSQAKILAKGTPGFTYNVEANDDLGNPNNWVFIGTAIVGGAGTMAFTDLDAVNYPHRFYRFRLP